jgi:hypothetical protein
LIPSTHHVFPFILLTGFDQKVSIKIGENPNLERKKEGEQPYLDGGKEKGCCTSPWFSSRHQQQGREGGGGETALDLGRSSVGEDTTQRAGKRRRRKNMGLEKY